MLNILVEMKTGMEWTALRKWVVQLQLFLPCMLVVVKMAKPWTALHK